MKRIIVTGCSGFIGWHLTKYLKERGNFVIGIDIKCPEFEALIVDEFVRKDLRFISYDEIFEKVDEIYHLAADMGGIGYIETHKADILWNNLNINLSILRLCKAFKIPKLLFTSSACVYPDYLQNSVKAKFLKEEDAWPAKPEEGYGEEKLIMEKACKYFKQDYGLDIRIARFHNIYGPIGNYKGGREKSPAAICRKIALAQNNDTIEIWGDGEQTRSYCYIDDCVEALYRLMQSDYSEPLNIGTDRLVSINQLVDIVAKIARKKISKSYNLNMPQGVKGRNADISKAKKILDWKPKVTLEQGLERTYHWIEEQLSLEKE